MSAATVSAAPPLPKRPPKVPPSIHNLRAEARKTMTGNNWTGGSMNFDVGHCWPWKPCGGATVPHRHLPTPSSTSLDGERCSSFPAANDGCGRKSTSLSRFRVASLNNSRPPPNPLPGCILCQIYEPRPPLTLNRRQVRLVICVAYSM